jgi:transcriptional regulator with XRE-family HTH domain
MVKLHHSGLARRLGRNLARYHRRARLTQEQLAEAIQMEVTTISRYETGATLPSLVTLENVAALSCVSIADLLTEETPPPSGEGEQIRGILEPLSPDERQAVLEVLTVLVGFLRKQGRMRSKRMN